MPTPDTNTTQPQTLEDAARSMCAAYDDQHMKSIWLSDHVNRLRAALAAQPAAPVVAEAARAAIAQARDWAAVYAAIDSFIEDYEMLGEAPDGCDACYTPNENDRALLKDAIHGLLSDPDFVMAYAPSAHPTLSVPEALEFFAKAAATSAQAERKPLTERQLETLVAEFRGQLVPAIASPELWFLRGVKAAERAHGIGAQPAARDDAQT